MIFGGRTKHKLPKFPADVESSFKKLCETLPLEAIDSVRAELGECVKSLHLLSKDGKRIKPELIDQLYSASLYLLDNYAQYNSQQKALAIGAIRYFAVMEDALPDGAFTSGLHDDAMVMNHVLEKLGGVEMVIDI